MFSVGFTGVPFPTFWLKCINQSLSRYGTKDSNYNKKINLTSCDKNVAAKAASSTHCFIFAC